MSFAGCFLVRSLLSAFPAYLRTFFRFDFVWFRLSCDHGWIRSGSVNVVVVVVVFFTLTDRASTIPSDTRGCQSGTWSAGQKNIRETSTKLQ